MGGGEVGWWDKRAGGGEIGWWDKRAGGGEIGWWDKRAGGGEKGWWDKTVGQEDRRKGLKDAGGRGVKTFQSRHSFGLCSFTSPL